MPPASPDLPALVAGCGDLGTEVALRLVAAGHEVVGLRRRAHLLPAGVTGLAVDLTREVPDLRHAGYRSLAVVLTADGSDADAYRATYVDGLRRTLDALHARGAEPDHAVLVSSTGVYGDTEGDVDEATPVAPSRPTHEILLEAERLFHDRLPHGTVLRLSGLYGPGRSTFIGQAWAGRVRERWTNRIHRDDAAAAIVHLLSIAGAPPLLIGSDTLPTPASEVAAFIRHPQPDIPVETSRETPTATAADIPGRRLSSAKLQDTGFALTYPTYREGYAAVLSGAGLRHP